MKNYILILVTGLSLALSGIYPNNNAISHRNEIDLQTDTKVYVCGGKYAEKFHSYSTCRGLNNCKGGIYSYDSQQAALNAGFQYCQICWK